MQCASRVAWKARKYWVFLLALGFSLVSATIAQAGSHGELLLREAGWHGRAIKKPFEGKVVRASTAPTLRGWSAGPVALGTGLSSTSGSRRVREVQRRLDRLGYATGPVDGLYGRRTRAAVGWFQRKHGLPVTGRASLATVERLRDRTTARATTQRPRPRATTPPLIAADGPSGFVSKASTVPSWLKFATMAYFLLHLVVGAAFLAIRRFRPRVTPSLPPRRSTRPVPAATPLQGSPQAIGYVRLAPDAPSAAFDAQAAALETGCVARGLTLVSLVSDVETGRWVPAEPTPALARALDRLRSGEIDRLVVNRLEHVARTREELRTLLKSISDRDGALVVLDDDLDRPSRPLPDRQPQREAESAKPMERADV